MRVVRLLTLGLLATGSAAALSAQIPTRRPSQNPAATAPRMLIGNPHTFNAQDSAPAVAIGDGLRTRFEKLVGNQFRVLSRSEMNDALRQFGYPADAILAPLPQRSLAQSLSARAMVSATLTRDGSGRYSVTARLAGLNDEAGTVVSLSQGAGQSPSDLGGRVGEAFAPSLKVWGDARGCVDQLKSAPAKAVQAAKKALEQVPEHGLANYCLGMAALAKGGKADSAEAMKFFAQAVKGDPLSLASWTQLAAGYEVAGDTTQTIEALKQMVRIAPTNQPLRELAFKKFLAYGHPEVAEQIADEGLKLDPNNPDLLDLLANARIFRENYSGALDALEQIVALDSTRADSTFYQKYLVTATAASTPDADRVAKWGSAALRRYPDNTTLLKQVTGAYAQVGLRDSLLGALEKLVAVDTASAVGFALQEAKNLQDNKQFKESDAFVGFAAKYGDAPARDGAAAFMLQGITPMLQAQPQNWPVIADSLRTTLRLAAADGRLAPIANYFLGLSLVNIIAGKDQEAEKQKSCDLAREVETLSAEAERALEGATGYINSPTGEGQRRTWDQLKGYVGGLKARTASMLRVYCK